LAIGRTAAFFLVYTRAGEQIKEHSVNRQHTNRSPVYELTQKIGKLIELGKERDDVPASIRQIAESIGCSHATLIQSEKDDMMSYELQQKLAGVYGFLVDWPEWRDTRAHRTSTISDRRDTADKFIGRVRNELDVAKSPLKLDDGLIQSTRVQVQVNYRRDSEARSADRVLLAASKVRFVALTYDTLHRACVNAIKQLPLLEEAELAIYALPIVREQHPILRGDESRLTKEWHDSLVGVLTRLSDKTFCPQLKRLTVRLISRVPTFTVSVLSVGAYPTHTNYMRYTPVLEDEPPSATPTIIISERNGTGAIPNSVYSAFSRIVDNMRSKFSPSQFPIVCRDDGNSFERTDIPAFVRQLALLCQLPDFAADDTLFSVRAKLSATFAKSVNLPTDRVEDNLLVAPDAVHQVFEMLRARGETDKFHVTFDLKNNFALIDATEKNEPFIEAAVIEPHCVGVFALMSCQTEQGKAVVLRLKGKPGWPFDVPGGKVADVDESIQSTISREIFEETGLLISLDRLIVDAATTYDRRSFKEGKPVIAKYCCYELSPEEQDYLANCYPSRRDDPDVVALTFYNVNKLIEEKKRHRDRTGHVNGHEAICHAPLEALQKLIG
jgi:ADP-ribose pyrophosphatase YjhB (NUDIX family)